MNKQTLTDKQTEATNITCKATIAYKPNFLNSSLNDRHNAGWNDGEYTSIHFRVIRLEKDEVG